MNKLSKIHLFVVRIGEIHPVHLHNLVSNLYFGRRHRCSSQQAEFHRAVLVILNKSPQVQLLQKGSLA